MFLLPTSASSVVSTIGHVVGGIAAAIVVKLVSSIDDVLWLSAFLTPNKSKQERTKNAITYGLICLVQTALAFLVCQFGSNVIDDLLEGGDDDDDDPTKQQKISTDRLLTLISGSALFLYSIVLGREYYQENYGVENDDAEISTTCEHMLIEDDSAERVHVAVTEKDLEFSQEQQQEQQRRPSLSGTPAGLDDVDTKVIPLEIEREEEDHVGDDRQPHHGDDDNNKPSRSLAIIAFLGSLDDLSLFIPMLAGKTFGILELMIGAMISAFFIVLLCICLTQCKPVAEALEKIPLVAIVLTFSVILLTKGIFLMK